MWSTVDGALRSELRVAPHIHSRENPETWRINRKSRLLQCLAIMDLCYCYFKMIYSGTVHGQGNGIPMLPKSEEHSTLVNDNQKISPCGKQVVNCRKAIAG
jgi:hypothetical protein